MERWFTQGFRERSPEAVAKVIEMLNATRLEGYVGSCEAIRDIDFRASTPTINAPTLVIVGRHDVAAAPEHGEAIHRMIMGAELLALEASHLSNIEQPQAYAAAVLSFLIRYR
jgi:3-oxoadipate enol-lactonase